MVDNSKHEYRQRKKTEYAGRVFVIMYAGIPYRAIRFITLGHSDVALLSEFKIVGNRKIDGAQLVAAPVNTISRNEISQNTEK